MIEDEREIETTELTGLSGAQKEMIANWAQATADRIVGDGSRPRGKLLFLGDAGGQDPAVGAIQQWRLDAARATIRAPGLDIHCVRCLTLGDVHLDIPSDWS